MPRTIDTGNALGAKVLWSDAFQDGDFTARTDEAGGRSLTALASAAIGLTDPGPGLGGLNGSTQAVTSSLASSLTLPFTMACMWRESGGNGTVNVLMSYVLDDSNYFTLQVDNTSAYAIGALARAGGSAATATNGVMAAFNTWYGSAAVFDSTTARRCWHNGGFGADNTTSINPSGAGKAIGVGANARASASQFLQGWVKYAVIFDGALTDAELDSWYSDPEQIYVGDTSTTVYAGVGNAVAAGAQATVANTGATTVNAGVGNAVAAGATAMVTNIAAGTITTDPLVNNTGTVLASETAITVAVLDALTGTLVVTKTNQTTNASGVMSINDPLIVAGTAYKVVYYLSSNRSNVPSSTAA